MPNRNTKERPQKIRYADIHQIVRGEGVQIEHFVLMGHIVRIQGLELFLGRFLAAEYTNDGHALNGFINNGVDLAQPGADDRIVFGCEFTVQDGPYNQHWNNKQTD